MKIGLFGYGKMGKMVKQAAIEKGHTISAIIDPKHKPDSTDETDIFIDFSYPKSVIDNVLKSAKMGKNLVIGTTGWQEDLNEVKKIVSKYQIGLLYSPNFSIGVQLFMRLVQKAALYLKDYDVAGTETHHSKKLDAPSGTAIALADILKKEMPSLNDDFAFSSIRCGSVPGTHTVMFDSPNDTITLTHQARNREGFANGAIQAAEWLNGKQGFYTIDDLLESYHV